MPKTHDLVAIVGSYTDKNGEEKKRYKNCGALIQKDGKMYIKMDAIPVPEEGAWNGWLSCFEPRDQQPPKPQSGTPASSVPHPDDPNDRIPF